MPLMKTPREGSGASSFPCMPFTPGGVGGVAILPILRTWWSGWPVWGGAWWQRYRSSRPSWTGPAIRGRTPRPPSRAAPGDPSPSPPASRLFWNECYLDVARIPELKDCPPAQALMTSGGVLRELEALRASPVVDYRRQMAVERL